MLLNYLDLLSVYCSFLSVLSMHYLNDILLRYCTDLFTSVRDTSVLWHLGWIYDIIIIVFFPFVCRSSQLKIRIKYLLKSQVHHRAHGLWLRIKNEHIPNQHPNNRYPKRLVHPNSVQPMDRTYKTKQNKHKLVVFCRKSKSHTIHPILHKPRQRSRHHSATPITNKSHHLQYINLNILSMFRYIPGWE